ncbi:MAG: ATP-binding cassette domain-containing protein, partial [Alphaproteobacteria bacterium]
MALLIVDNLKKHFGGNVVLDDVSLEVEPGQIQGIIGPNGAGKTTLFNVVNGIYSASGGTIIFKGK